MWINSKICQHAIHLEFVALMRKGIEHVRCRLRRGRVQWWTMVARLQLWWRGSKVGAGLRVDGPIRIDVHSGGRLKIGENVAILSRSLADITRVSVPPTFVVGVGADLIIGVNVRIRGPVFMQVHSNGRFEIGGNVRIQSGLMENVVGWYMPAAFVVGTGASLSIGANAALSNCAIACDCSIKIGTGVYVGGGACIYDTDFHSLMAAERLAGDEGTKRAPIVLENNSFIGGHTIILKGSVVGSGAVLGAGTVLAGKVPAGEVWAGNPARKVGEVPTQTKQANMIE